MSDQKKLAIIATKGTLDWAYPPLILATTAAALDYEVHIFWTFYGLQVLKKNRNLKISPLGNPGMPMPVDMPVLVQALPGMEAMATTMMKGKMKSKGVASIDDLMELAVEAEVNMIACQMTVDLFDFKHEELMDGVEYAGAARFFDVAGDADITLYI
uniref:Peroxiredoxin family protein n=1 Tax=Magnetococcus massalia (strain MO-1) TaxID=451514 RepID=A0A1S7LKW3_MAGMO|nr:conserved protein of unknown function [Candidatus Magnetococcus massalia]